MEKFKHPLLGEIIKFNSCGYWGAQAKWGRVVEVRLYTDSSCIEPILNQYEKVLLYIRNQEHLFKKRVAKDSIFLFANLEVGTYKDDEERICDLSKHLSLSSIFIFDNHEVALLFDSKELFWGSPVAGIFNSKGEIIKVELWSPNNKRKKPYIHLSKRPS